MEKKLLETGRAPKPNGDPAKTRTRINGVIHAIWKRAAGKIGADGQIRQTFGAELKKLQKQMKSSHLEPASAANLLLMLENLDKRIRAYERERGRFVDL
ncbi:MAG: hypothetical protein AABW99_01245 [archaeon]